MPKLFGAPTGRIGLADKEPRLVKFFGFNESGISSPAQFLKDLVLDMGFLESPKASLAIFREDPVSMLEGLSLSANTDTRVLLCSELRGLDFDSFDYVIGWEPGDHGDRYVRLHPANREFRTLSMANPLTPLGPFKQRAFCDFIYSNPTAHPFRDKFYRVLSDARSVDSLGPHLFNGVGLIGSGQIGNWEADKIQLQSHYKFSIAIENATYAGYTTEKLLTPIVAGSIPIYWGNPKVGEDFNEARFINLHRFEDMHEAVAHILSIAENHAILEKIAHQPLLTNNQSIGVEKNKRDVQDLIERAYHSSQLGILRRPFGTSPWQREVFLIRALKSRKRRRILQDIIDWFWLKLRGNMAIQKLLSRRNR
jgi:hypothetical protein